jgi:hypothetical protein
MSFEELSGVSKPPDDHPHDDHGAAASDIRMFPGILQVKRSRGRP